MAKLTKSKAKKILKEGKVRGKKLSRKQQKFFGAMAGGQKPYKNTGHSAPKGMHKMPNGMMMSNAEMRSIMAREKMVKRAMPKGRKKA